MTSDGLIVKKDACVPILATTNSSNILPRSLLSRFDLMIRIENFHNDNVHDDIISPLLLMKKRRIDKLAEHDNPPQDVDSISVLARDLHRVSLGQPAEKTLLEHGQYLVKHFKGQNTNLI